MEPRFQKDFSGVRIHCDGHAAQMTNDLHAEAFTIGQDIFFGPGRYAPETASGKRLLAHELTHVVQQLDNPSSGIERQWIQRFTLKGFPPTEAAAMTAAIPVAASKVLKCPELGIFDRICVAAAIKDSRYDFVKDLGACAWTFPSSWYIEIGKSAFDKSACCDLPSTIAHEASHTCWFFESSARELECDCFGCSC
jgi:hypothetical protein